ncbi:PAS domain S-box protein [Alkalinema sp. FACHB-956]|uniref:PAS domain S-box protein n=1 Tax=Alkalinema sp. FACHB-956 TaxID=2692768 RepID=UPI00168900AB|nr:PAS domain S-box protein [Alkalinema sp. FACHB-956]MBD2325723.1 PAS domain S-box protein [Alkalinema sp. FACHB-956]
MDLRTRSLPQVDLRSIILREPLVADASTTVLQAITQMSCVATMVPALDSLRRSRCVVVLDGEEVLGVVSEQAVLRLVAQQAPIAQIPLSQLLPSPALTLKESNLTDWVTVIQFMEQHQISYLPIVDVHDRLTGLLSYECLQQLAQFSQQASTLIDQCNTTNEQLQTELVERHQTTIELQASEQRYAALVAASPVGIVHTDNEGICTYVNDRYCEILGLDATALLGQPWSVGYRPEDLEHIVEEYEKAHRENRLWAIEYQIQRPDGSDAWIYGQVAVEYNAEGQEIGFVGTITDISDRKRTEFLLESQHKVLERIAKSEPLSDILDALLRTTEFHLPGTLCSILLCQGGHLHCAAAPSLPLAYCAAVNGAPIREGIGSCGTAAFRREVVIVSDIATDPLWRDYQALALTYDLRACWSAPIVSGEGTVLGVFGIYYREQRVPQPQDLDRLRQSAHIAGIAIERSQAIEALHQLNQELECRVEERTAALQASENRWQLAFNGSKAGIWDWDLQNNVKFYSHGWKQNRGYEDEEISDSVEEFFARIHPDDYENLMVIMAALRSGETDVFEVEYRSCCKDGSYIWVLDRGQAWRDASGQVVRILGTEIDITDRKHIEAALADSEAKFRRLIEGGQDVIWSIDSQDRFTYLSPQFKTVFGWEPSEWIGRPSLEAVYPDDREWLIQQRLLPAINTAQSYLEFRHCHRDRPYVWVRASTTPVMDATGQVIGYQGILTDITDRKMAEMALQASQAQYQRLTENIPGVIYRYVLYADGQDAYTYLGACLYDMFELESEAVLQSTQPLWDRVHPDDIPHLQAIILQSAQTLQPCNKEFRVILAHGRIKWIQFISQPEQQSDGSLAWDGIFFDVTDRKTAEIALQASERRYASLAAAAPVAIFRFDAQLNCTYVNDRWSEMTGRPAESALGRGWLNALHPEEREQTRETLAELQKSLDFNLSSLATGEGRHLNPDGTINWFYSKIVQEFDDSGQMIGFIGTLTDITDRKTIEQELILKKKHLTALLNNIPHIAWIKDEQSRFIAVNQPFAEACGVAADDLIGQTDYDIWPADLAEAYRDDDFQVLQSGQRKVVEERVAMANGTLGWLETTKTPFRNVNGAFAGTVGIAADITDRKTAEIALRESERRYASLAVAAPVAIFRFDAQHNCTYLNDRWSEMTGRPIESGYGLGWLEAIHPDDRSKLAALVWSEANVPIAPEAMSLSSWEGRHLHPDGTITWFYVQTVRELDESGNLLGYVGTLTDITDRKRIEAELAESEAKFRRLVEGGQDLIWSADAEDRFTYLSPQFKTLFGWEPSDWIGRLAVETVYPDDRPLFLEHQSIEHVGTGIGYHGGTGIGYMEFRHLHRDLPYIWVRVSVKPIFDPEGQIVGFQGTLSDITSLKNAELALQESERRYASLAAAVPVAIYRFDSPLNCVYVNERWSEITGRPRESALGQGWIDGLHPDDRDQLLETWENLWQQASPSTQYFQVGEWRHLRPDGTINWFYSQVAQELDSDGNVIGYVGTLTDITDRKMAELALQESQTQFHRMTENVPGMIFRYVLHPDKTDEITYVSSQVREIFAIEPETALQNVAVLWERVHPDDLSAVLADVLVSAQTLEPFATTYRLLLPDQGVRWVQHMTHAERLENGDVIWDGIVVDVTDRKCIETQLAQSRQKYYSLIQSVNGIVWEYDLQTDRFIFVSHKAEEILGYSISAWLNEPNFWRNHVYEADLEKVEQQFNQAICAQQNCEMEYRMIAADGSLVWVYDVSSLNLDENGELTRSSGVLIDIRDRKQAEQALQALAERLDFALEGANIGIWEWSATSNRLIWDSRMFALYGIQPEEFSGQYEDWFNRVHPDDRAYVQQAEQESLQGTRDPLTEFRITWPDGTVRFIESRAFKHRNNQGEVIKAVGLNLDITDRKKAEQALQASQHFIQKIADASPNILFIYDLQESRNIYVNHAITPILGYTEEQIQVLGTTLFTRLMHPEDRERLPSYIAQLYEMQDGEIREFEYRMRHSNGEWRWLHSRDSVFSRDDQGRLKQTIGTAQDITDRKQAEIQLQHTNEELLRATRLKDEFLANMSHELRTPLNAILGMSEALQEQIFGTLNDRQLRSLKTIENSGHHLLALINDILDVAKIESGQVTLEYQSTNIKLLCQSSLTFIKQQAFKKNIQIDLQLPDQLPQLWVDERRIRQVLINLLTNAVKFTPDNGQITLMVNAPIDASTIEISIIDTGIGIAPEHQSKLFQPFIQIDSALNRQYSGTGLGLALVKQIAELHGGEVRLTSEVGVGSCFTIELPCHPPSETLVQPES